MNTNIKKIIVILILLYSNINNILSEDLIITIPEKFNRYDYPLPPFPSEVINSLKTESIEIDDSGKLALREIGLFEINYTEFFNIHNFSIDSSYKSSYGFLISTDLNGITPGVQYLGEGNKLKFRSELGYEYIDETLYYIGEYRDYRIPYYNQLDINTLEKSYSLSLGIKEYKKSITLTNKFEDDSYILNFKYINKYSIKPYLDYTYKSESNFYGDLGISIKNSVFGISNSNLTIYPYINFNFNFNNINFEVNSLSSEYEISYQITGSLLSFKKFNLGLGGDIEHPYKNFDPYIIFNESIFPGYRTYKLYLDNYEFSNRFINNNYVGIINLSFSDFNLIKLSMELEGEKLKLCNSVDFTIDKSEFSYNLNLTIWAGN